MLWDSQDGRADNWIKYHLLICNSIGCMKRYILIQQFDWVKSPFWKYDYRQVRLLFLCSSDVCLKYEVWGFTFRSTFFLWSTFSRLRWATPYAFLTSFHSFILAFQHLPYSLFMTICTTLASSLGCQISHVLRSGLIQYGRTKDPICRFWISFSL